MPLVQIQSETPCNSYVAFPFNKTKAEKFMCERLKNNVKLQPLKLSEELFE